MAEPRDKDERPVLASLLDRLTDDDPDNQQEVPLTGRKLDRALREAIRRDIEGFLNTRCRPLPVDPALQQAQHTIVDYGIPDFMGQSLAAERQCKQFLRRIGDALRAHEPRFKSVDVEIADGLDPVERSFRFRIRAVVYAEPAPESLSFDSRVEPVSRTFSIQ